VTVGKRLITPTLRSARRPERFAAQIEEIYAGRSAAVALG
jgi:hypothetical protein